MTKKSAGRKMRDQLKNDTLNFRNDAEDIYSNIRIALLQHGGLIETLLDDQIKTNLPDPSLVAQHVNILSKDILELQGELEAIHDMHKDKSGALTTPQEAIEHLNICEAYHTLMEKHQGVVMPIVNVIIGQITAAETSIAQRNVEASAEVAQQHLFIDDNTIDITHTTTAVN